MKENLFSVFDEQAKMFKYHFFRVRNGEAIRFFSDGVKDGKSEMARHPEDFSLFSLGLLDNESGEFVAWKIPERLARATDFLSEVPITGGA